jgi:hypothetical protein
MDDARFHRRTADEVAAADLAARNMTANKRARALRTEGMILWL